MNAENIEKLAARLASKKLTQDILLYGPGRHITTTKGACISSVVSDGAYVTGAYVERLDSPIHKIGLFCLDERLGPKCVRLYHGNYYDRPWDTFPYGCLENDRTSGFLPVFSYSLVKDVLLEEKELGTSAEGHKIYEATLQVDELGKICGDYLQGRLEQLLQENKLQQVGHYPMDSRRCDEIDEEFKLRECPIYMAETGKKYIRIEAPRPLFKGRDGYGKVIFYEEGTPFWLTIENPKIIYDSMTNFAVYRQMAISGIRPKDLDTYKKEYWFPRFVQQIEIARENKRLNSAAMSDMVQEFDSVCVGDGPTDEQLLRISQSLTSDGEEINSRPKEYIKQRPGSN